MASRRRKFICSVIFLFSLGAAGMLSAAVATPRWISAVAFRQNITNTDEPPAVPDENGRIPQFTGYIQFGLFNGQKIFNYGFEQRDPVYFSIFEEHKDIYSIGYPIAVIIFTIIAAVFALVSAIFALVNVLTVPIETIHGPAGLGLWNGLGAISSLVAWVLYIVLFSTELQKNVLIQEDIDPPNLFETNSVVLDYSFWLVLSSFNLFLITNLWVYMARRLQNDPDFMRPKKRGVDLAKGKDNVALDDIMY